MRKICKLKDYIAVFVTFATFGKEAAGEGRTTALAMFWWWWRRCHGVSMFHGYASRKLNFRININNKSTRRAQTTSSFEGRRRFLVMKGSLWPDQLSVVGQKRESSWETMKFRARNQCRINRQTRSWNNNPILNTRLGSARCRFPSTIHLLAVQRDDDAVLKQLATCLSIMLVTCN